MSDPTGVKMIVAITEARTLDPATGEVREGQTVVVEGGVIRAVEPGSAPGDARRVVKARGRVVLPGLIDAHVHLASFAGDHDMEIRGVTPDTIAESTLRGAASAARMCRSGVTTVRDLGCKHAGIFALRRAIAMRQHVGPRLVVAGAGITMTGGTASRSAAIEADGADAVRHAARSQLKASADLVKLFISGAILHPSASDRGVQYAAEEIGAGIQEAHRVGKPVAVHASWADAIRTATELGADTVEHGHEIPDALAGAMAARGVFLVPTLWHYQRVAEHGEELGFRDAIIARARQVRDLHAQSFLRAWRAGVPIAAGTDSGGPEYPPGSLHLELRYMAGLGMPAMDVLRAATSGAARCLRLEDRVGRLEPGYEGDLIGVAADPLRDLEVLARPWLVMKAGEVVILDEA
ncbi:MAG: amidohydrolase family protein [Armatimonadetes bacterium]|nr:amidohydrolase family protein [Armatimonadota bacterium]